MERREKVFIVPAALYEAWILEGIITRDNPHHPAIHCRVVALDITELDELKR